MATAGLTVAVSKGRILHEALPLLARAGLEPAQDLERSRKLVVGTSRDDVRLVVVRAQDVPTYVEHGAADLGIAGKDVLLEHEGDGLYEPLDLDIARCRLMVAGPRGAAPAAGRLRVATKFVMTTRRHFARQGIQAEIIKLYGSMELAPLVGLADRIVDLVDSGRTLAANGLEPLEEICPISSRLVVNKASMKMKHEKVKGLIEALTAAVRARGEQTSGAAP
jgi:ATP phosphoribosyltransferase